MVQAAWAGELGDDWVGWLIGLVGILAAAFFYWRSTIGARLVFQARGYHLIGGPEALLPGEVTISFKDTPVPRLTSAVIVFWNAGRATIRGADIVESDPIRIIFPEGTHLLRDGVTSATRSVVAAKTNVSERSPNELFVSFDFLDPGDGLVIEVLHTGEERFPAMAGTVRGMPKGIRDWGAIVRERRMKIRMAPGVTELAFNSRAFFLAVFVSSLAALLAGLAPYSPEHLAPKFVGRHPDWLNSGHIVWPLVAGALLYTFLAGFALWVERRRFPKSLRVENIS